MIKTFLSRAFLYVALFIWGFIGLGFSNLTFADGIPTTSAPTPTEDPANVISIFSNTFTNIDGVNVNPNWGQSTQVSFVEIEGNNTLKYANFNYQGTEFPALDVSSKTSVHLDMWTADATTVNFTIISPGAEKLFSLPITAGQWVSYTIPLAYFDNVNLENVFQLKFDGGSGAQTIYLDNIFFSGEDEGVVPPPPAPVGFVMNPGAGSGEIFFAAGPNQVGGDIVYRLFYSLSSAVPGDPTTATEYSFGTTAGDGGGTAAFGFNLSGLEPGESYTAWLYQYNSATETFSAPSQLQANAGGSTGGGGTPTTAAPTPTEDPANVISIFSDSYTNIDGVNVNPNWAQSTQVSFVEIEGNNTLKYANFNYQGTEFPTLDVSGMTTFHVDMWTADATTVNFTVISPGPQEKLVNLPVTAGEWVSYEIPLSFFDNVNLSQIFQLKFEGGNGSQTIYLDNIFFSGEPETAGELVTFSINMNYQQDLGIFQPEAGDLVYVRGEFNGWSTIEGQEMLETNSGIYELTLFVEGIEGSEFPYKYYILSGDGRELPNTGWENNGVGPVGNNGDRLLVLSGEDQILDIVWFNNEEGTNTNYDSEIPLLLTLNQNYPNPFNPSTQIQYALPESGQVRLDVYTISGQLVATLVNGTMSAGTHSVTFNANSYASGVYLYRLQAGNLVISKKMTLLK